MELYLVQHGKAFTKEEDPERGLTPEGISHVERIAGVAKGYGINVSGIRHSGKKRALETGKIFASSLLTDGNITKEDGLQPNDDVEDYAKNISPDSDIMIVGHLPFMEKLTSLLVTGSAESTVFKFQNGDIVCLDKDESRGWFIKWALMPEVS